MERDREPDNPGDRRPIGDFGFGAKFVFGFVFGGLVGTIIFFVLGRGMPREWLLSPSPKYFIGIVLAFAVVFGLMSGFLTGGKWWKR